jgi:hypothetical protein
MQDNPYFAAIGGTLRYLVESGQWVYVLGVLLLIAFACALAPRREGKRSFVDRKFSMWD